MSGIVPQVIEGCSRLQQMLEIAYCVSGAHLHELEIHTEHLRRIFELIISSPLLDKFKQFLAASEEATADLYLIKASILRCICLLSIGNELFTDGSDLKQRLLYLVGDMELYTQAFR